MRAYHDDEWGRPVQGESAHLERLTLEAFQSGLSWRTILLKRPAFRAAFDGFDADAIAAYDEADVARLMADAGIVRNHAKVNAAITNARATVALRDHGGLVALIEEHRPAVLDPAGHHRRPPAQDGRVPRAVQGSEEGRVRVRRADHDACADGGDRAGRRPPAGLPRGVVRSDRRIRAASRAAPGMCAPGRRGSGAIPVGRFAHHATAAGPTPAAVARGSQPVTTSLPPCPVSTPTPTTPSATTTRSDSPRRSGTAASRSPTSSRPPSRAPRRSRPS